MKTTPTINGFCYYDGMFCMEAQATCSSQGKERKWAIITIVCPNGDRVAVTCTAKTTRVGHLKKGKK